MAIRFANVFFKMLRLLDSEFLSFFSFYFSNIARGFNRGNVLRLCDAFIRCFPVVETTDDIFYVFCVYKKCLRFSLCFCLCLLAPEEHNIYRKTMSITQKLQRSEIYVAPLELFCKTNNFFSTNISSIWDYSW